MHNLPYNGRKPLIASPAMRQITRFAAVFAASFALAGAAFAQSPVYSVRDLSIDKVAPSAAEAQLQGRNDAKLAGAQRLIERLTLPEDRSQARQPIDTATIASRAFRSYQSQGEKSSPVAGGYRATGFVSVSYREADVRSYLDSLGVPYVDSQAALAMIVPVAAAGVDPGQWAAQWTTVVNGQTAGKSDNTVLTPYVGSTESWNRRPAWADVQEELTRVRADHGVIAEAYQQGSQYYVRLVDMRANIPNPDIGIAGPFVSLQSAQAGAIAELERAWKSSSIVRGSGSTNMTLVASFSGIQEWVKIRKSLEASRLVKQLNIESLSTVGADVTFAFTGRPEQLAADLRSKGVDLSGGNGNWLLRVSAPQ